MQQLLIRFGLPWIIFGLSIYALFWNIWYGEFAITAAPNAAITASAAIAPADKRRGEIKPVAPEQENQVIARAPTTDAVAETITLPAEPSIPAQRAIPADPVDALQASDASARLNALSEIDAQGIAVPAHTLQQMATSDPDPSVRTLALTKYAQDPSVDPAMVQAAAETAARDNDPSISAHAQEILEQLAQATRSNDEVQPQLLGEALVE